MSAASKRKRDWLSYFDSHRPLPLALNHRELFRQLFFARFQLYPYNNFESWSDDRLWNKIANILRKPKSDIAHVVMGYQQLYDQDNTLPTVYDDFLKQNIQLVFGPLLDAIAIEDFQRLMQSQQILQQVEQQVAQSRQIVPSLLSTEMGPIVLPFQSSSSGEPVGYESENGIQNLLKKIDGRMRVEIGLKGCLAVQYGEDIKSLELDARVQKELTLKYGPESTEYMSIASYSADTRREMLVAYLDDVL